MFNLQHIRHVYIPNQDVLPKEISIERGGHLLLLGPSGCGKTTLMNMMATLLPLESGEITFDDKSYSGLSQAQKNTMREESFGFIFQRHHLIGHLNVVQNIAVAQTRKDPAYIKSLIRTIGLEGKEKQKARNLSVGEAQRVAIARALANKPKVIFADEPTSALDDRNTRSIIDLIFDQAETTNATIIAATHDARIKSRFKNILEMSA